MFMYDDSREPVYKYFELYERLHAVALDVKTQQERFICLRATKVTVVLDGVI